MAVTSSGKCIICDNWIVVVGSWHQVVPLECKKCIRTKKLITVTKKLITVSNL